MTNTHKPASTGIIRHVLQQLESLKVNRERTTAPGVVVHTAENFLGGACALLRGECYLRLDGQYGVVEREAVGGRGAVGSFISYLFT